MYFDWVPGIGKKPRVSEPEISVGYSQFITTRVIFGFCQGISAKFASTLSHNILNIAIIDIET
jgi:hypothetical protein